MFFLMIACAFYLTQLFIPIITMLVQMIFFNDTSEIFHKSKLKKNVIFIVDFV
jgi:positive regulator of sigma E activity